MMCFEEGMATQSSILAWRIPWTEEPGRLQSMGSNRVECNWTDLACVHNILLSFGPCFPLWLISYRLTVSAPCTEILEVLQMSNVHISLLVCAYSLLCMAHPSHLSLFLLHNSCPHFHSAFPFRSNISLFKFLEYLSWLWFPLNDRLRKGILFYWRKETLKVWGGRVLFWPGYEG